MLKSKLMATISYLNYQIEDIKGEVWRDINGYDGIYSVSNYGRIKAEQREIRCGKGWLIKPEKIMKQQVVKSNPQNIKEESKSLRVSLCVDYVKKTFNVSELVGNSFIGKKKKNQVYSKKNKKWFDCRSENLEIKSISESIKIAYEKGNNLRKKKHLNFNQDAKFIYIRINDGKEFFGGRELKKHYKKDVLSNIDKAIKKDIFAYQSKWNKRSV